MIYGDLSIIYPKPYSIYLRETIALQDPPKTPSARRIPGKYWENQMEKMENDMETAIYRVLLGFKWGVILG